MNDNFPLLSVIVPVYNVEKYLQECIKSLINQNLDSMEIILVDDGSDDNSGLICDDYKKKYQSIKVIHQNNQGQMKATLRGLEIASGKYIGFVDSDDYVALDTYPRMLDVAKKTNSDIITMAGVRFLGKKEKAFCDKISAGTYNRKQIEKYIIPNLFSNHDLYGNRGIQPSKCLKIFKSDLIRKTYSMIPCDIEMGEDLLTTYTATINAKSLSIIDKKLIGYHYRLNPGSVSWVYKKNLFEKSMKLCSYLRDISTVKENSIYQAEVDYEVCFFAINAFFNEYLMKNSISTSERKQHLKDILERKEFTEAVSRIKVDEVKQPNRVFIKLMKEKKLDALHFIGCMITLLRVPITAISQRVV